MPSLIDGHTRRCLALHVAWTIRARDVIAVVGKAFAQHGAPEHIRSDNGPEFIACALQDWLSEKQVKTIYMTPGSPWERSEVTWLAEGNPEGERCICEAKRARGKLSRQVPGRMPQPRTLWQPGRSARIVEGWRKKYHGRRPHSAPGYLTPNEYEQKALEKMAPAAVEFTRPTKTSSEGGGQSPTAASFELK